MGWIGISLDIPMRIKNLIEMKEPSTNQTLDS